MWHFEICFNPVADEIRKRLLTFRIHSVIFIGISLEDESNLFPGFVSLKSGNRLIMVSLISQSFNIILRKFRFIVRKKHNEVRNYTDFGGTYNGYFSDKL